MSKKNFIILSSVDWDTHRQLHHELVHHLLNQNHRVLFVENTGTRSLRIGDFSRVKKRVKDFLKSNSGFTIKKKI